jgi:class 3 adenylate cyclase/tetratricopeptide (TPR) repeat protein
LTCSSCGAVNPAAAKFCLECGKALGRCGACGSAVSPTAKFCGECGATVAADDSAPATAETRRVGASPPPAAERRVVSVLFADLVGFTSLSEARDPEEVRELLSRYFEVCRRLVELYGGAVEKFIGDAVMAVWGAPVAQEDDAERAVRAALDVVAAVSALGDELAAPGLRARAGVLTGEAAVNPAATGEGMVAGDLVNAAARIQAAAQPGTVLVGEATRRASELAIAFEEAGTHAVKGKSEPLELWRAVRVTAARGGALRSEGLEAPFVGRERELRLAKELFHASAEQSRAQLLQVTGIAGIGKSRLAWEFFKYIDGLAGETILWHRGRCLSYGEGVAYWALAEMVRTRAQIVEAESPESAREKLARCVATYVPDEEERLWVEPRLANLLALEDRADTDRQDLFAAWRLFFERIAEHGPVVMVFEDLQWADQALLSFIEYLLEWSAAKRLYVLALSRPELAERRPEFGRSVRNVASLALEPLAQDQMEQLLERYVPGLPDDVKTQVLDRAQGVPLYAVETVRMLLDRGLLVRAGPIYRPTAEIATLEVPATLHALVAARLDGLPKDEREVVQQAAVLGKTFTKQALAAVCPAPVEDLEPLLAALVRKEVFSLQADPRMPDRGQYGFLQELLRQIAYETLSRHERKARHLAAVDALARTFPGAEQEVPEVIAAHLLAAAAAVPDEPDASDIRLRARTALVQAGERAAALAAPDEAQRYVDEAAALARDEPAIEAELHERAGALAYRAGHTDDARSRITRAIALHEAAGDRYAAARAGVALADVDVSEGRLDEGSRRLEAALPTLEEGTPGPELAASYASLGRLRVLRGDLDGGARPLEQALAVSERLGLEEIFIQALTSKALLLQFSGRLLEAQALLEGAVARGRDLRHPGVWWRPRNNLIQLFMHRDHYRDAADLAGDVERQARQLGDREAIAFALSGATPVLVALGRWDDALAAAAELERLDTSRRSKSDVIEVIPVLCEQGRLDDAVRLFRMEEWQRDAEQPELKAAFAGVEARLLRAQREPVEALAAAKRSLAYRNPLTAANYYLLRGFIEALEAAVELNDQVAIAEILGAIDGLGAGERTPLLAAHSHRFHARAGDDPDRNFSRAEEIFGDRGVVFHQALTELEHGEWLLSQGRADEARVLAAQARPVFERLGATSCIERAEAAVAEKAEVPA